MADRLHFSKRDIGAEILPILTTGLYKYTLDAFREYIQNSIDAASKKIELIIGPSTVAIVDDGKGMTKDEASRAKRLGISDKNPKINVGFRGIGIYSAFNLCDLLEVYTKSKDESSGNYIKFDFKTIRTRLAEEQERRKKGLPSKLYLEKLLEGNVYVEVDDKDTIKDHGTKVIMSGMTGESSYLNWESTEKYLQDVVPLPFHPEFKFGAEVEKRFEDEDYRVVPLTLQIHDRKQDLYRPYTNDIFSQGGVHRPKYFKLKHGKKDYGFAWVCINDERSVLKNSALRGLLIKKFGFSIANRSYLEHFFKRPVFNRRITGEIIIQNLNLLPNAARSDFESNSTRLEFLELVLPKFIKDLSDWANVIQEESKALDVLTDVTSRVSEIAKEILTSRRDKEKMLTFNSELIHLEHLLKGRKKRFEDLEDHKEQYNDVMKSLKDCISLVKNTLLENMKSSRRLEEDVAKSIQTEAKLSAVAASLKESTNNDLVSVFEYAGIQLTADVQKALKLLEKEFLIPYLEKKNYQSMLKELRNYFDEKF